ncbi:disease resistance protein RUN1-like [Vigna angularis]|uniref:disease resistance protein RUN1-like n=1 Tax=Phaseolus angularis TaxID=3914 RepID=UPI0022B4967A|nr:disease resistance protein RUN1-like [Vigna angularis]
MICINCLLCGIYWDFRVAIVVFTKTYAQSAWCLHQLQEIIRWHQSYSRHVLPIYYEVDPSDVRLQKGDFGKAFKATAHQTFSAQQLEHGMSRWSQALTKAANFFGWDERNHRSDAELVDKIVKSLLNLPVLSATKFPVGLHSRAEDVIRIIKSNSKEVCILGICGKEESGKTTLAKAIYNQIHGTFTEKSFIEGQVGGTREYLRLRKQLFLEILKTKMEIPSVDIGRTMIRERLSGKRMLIVLDNATYLIFLDLWYCRKSFDEGTVIILTTRYESLMKDKVNCFYRVELMKAEESLELISSHAFREAKPKEEYKDLARRVVSHCGGLPLVLEVIGSTLFERTEEEWHSVLFQLMKISSDYVEQKLKIGFDGLFNQIEKDLFLDICCFFVGKDKAYATKILNGCGVDTDIGLRLLMERNLIKVNKNNKLGMHHLLQKMGITIILDNTIKEHGKNTRLWFDKYERFGTKAYKWFLPQGNVEVSVSEYLEYCCWITMKDMGQKPISGFFRNLMK